MAVQSMTELRNTADGSPGHLTSEVESPETPGSRRRAQAFPAPSPQECEEFLLAALFGFGDDLVLGVVNVAYTDLQRTLGGIASADSRGVHRRKAARILAKELRALPRRLAAEVNPESRQVVFDGWHRGTCDALLDVYADSRRAETGERIFRLGHAQKWLNMAVKYCSVLRDRAVEGFWVVFPCGHVPIDTFVIERLKGAFGFREPAGSAWLPWSRIDSYEIYMDLQLQIRKSFAGELPLAVEFHLWNEAARARAARSD